MGTKCYRMTEDYQNCNMPQVRLVRVAVGVRGEQGFSLGTRPSSLGVTRGLDMKMDEDVEVGMKFGY